MRMRIRSGLTLVELMVGLTVGGIVSGASVGALLHMQRTSAQLARRGEAERLGHEVLSVLSTIGYQLRRPYVLGDTALQAELRLVAGVTCAVGPSSITLAPMSPGSLDALTFASDMPAQGDLLEVYREDSSEGPRWDTSRIVEVSRLVAAEGCGTDTPFASPELRDRQVVRLTLQTSWLLTPGSPAEVFREIRLLTYPTAGQGWMLGWRACPQGICGPVQPIVGPLRSRAEGGLTLRQDSLMGWVHVGVRVYGVDAPFEGTIGNAAARP